VGNVGVRYSNVRFNNGTLLGSEHIVGLPDVSGMMVQLVTTGCGVCNLCNLLLFLSTFTFWQGWARLRLQVWLWRLLLALVAEAGPSDKTVHNCGRYGFEEVKGRG
jgi:hypothetical protein